jgi:hypothetical protein
MPSGYSGDQGIKRVNIKSLARRVLRLRHHRGDQRDLVVELERILWRRPGGVQLAGGADLGRGGGRRFDAANIEGKANTSATLFSGSVGTTLDWFGTVRGRVGFLVTPSALFYGTGGWAYGRTTRTANAAGLRLGWSR